MEGLPTTTKTERRSRSKNLHTSKPSLVMAFFSCVAWLYVAGRLWQDAENRKLLANLLKRNIEQKPKILTIEDKLMVLGCKDLERRIVEVEMDLTLAKSQGYLKHQLPQSESSSQRKLLAVIGVYTGFGSYLKRNTFRGSWMPRGDALEKLEERGVVIRFVIGRRYSIIFNPYFIHAFLYGLSILFFAQFHSFAIMQLVGTNGINYFEIGSANRGDSLDRHIDEENSKTKDFFILERHEEAQEELPKKIKFFFSTAVQNWDAEFYIKVDDNIDVDLEGLIGLLEHRRRQDSAYIGCMKSGEVVSEEGKLWYEPEWWKFADEKSYFRHASGSLLILSKNLAQYINTNSASLKTYAHDDISVGSWMMGVQAIYIDDNRLCCSSIRQDKVCSVA
ncbi:hypothetical protein CXB51_020909 [Gossypium anomalum]|uniref:Hexosyltransferase n=1 Tax=Gossypium anomalum TaxID=47600 RepID=A0A8J5YDW2_9ROSI|nr:hypothetical protein CXB51_020909 [Gossypium anomalum]